MIGSDLPDTVSAPNDIQWHPTRSAVLARLTQFLPEAGRSYAALRNYDYGPSDRRNISGLSPWIRYRLLTEQEVLSQVLSQHGYASAAKFTQEVFWRGYFKGWLEQRPSVWLSYLRDLELKRQTVGADYHDAVSGRIGIDCFDHWAKDLVQTGYLHNHARMWFASIWIFTLRLPWQLGADFFLRHLLDGDPASNTLSWRWVAGLHTKGKTYLARADNIAKYTNGRFSPKNLATNAKPLVEADAHPLRPIPASVAPEAGPYLLLLTDEDVGGASMTPHEPEAVIGLIAPGDLEGRGAHSRAFTTGAMADALAPFAQSPILADDWSQALLDAAAECGVRRIVTPYAPIGPTRARLDRATPVLASHGIELIRVQRAYDSLVWPHATGGYFRLKKKIPLLLRDLNLPD